MAATQYQIFCKYFNENVNKIVSNESPKEWISAEEWYQCKIAYNVTDSSQANVLLTSQKSINTGLAKDTPYRVLYDALLNKMEADDHTTGIRLTYELLSSEEKIVYDLCSRYEEIIKMIGTDDCVIEYAMIRPLDHLSYSYSTQDKNFDKQGTERNLKRAAKSIDSDLYNVVFDQNRNDNPKYDMIFTYNGMTQTSEQFDLYKYKTTVKTGDNSGAYTVVTPGCVPIESFNPPKTPGEREATVTLSTVTEAPDMAPSCMYERMERLKVSPWFYICTCNSLITAMNKARELVDIYGKDAVKIGKIVPLDQYIDIV